MLPTEWQDMFFATLQERAADPNGMTYITTFTRGEWDRTRAWGNVLGWHVRVTWKNDESGTIALGPRTLSEFDEQLAVSEEIAISTTDDWETVAADVHRRLTVGT